MRIPSSSSERGAAPAEILSSRVTAQVLVLVVVIAALALVLIGTLAWQERALGALALLAVAAGTMAVWRILRLVRLDTARQRALHEELAEYVRMLGEAQRAGRVGLWNMDYTLERLDASPETWDMLGVAPDMRDLRGFRAAMHPDDRARFQQAVQGARASRTRIELNYRIVTPGGEVRLLHAVAGPRDPGAGGLADRLTGVVQDVTEQARVEEELARYRDSLEQMVEARTAELRTAIEELEAFSYSVSHDLRGPLRGIDGFSQALLEEYGERLDENGRDYLRRVRAGVQRMGQLIDDLLKLARMSRLELQRSEVNLGALAEGLLEQLRERDGGATRWQVQPGLRAWGDEGLLRVLLENLLGNAWKFSARMPEPHIEFAVQEQDGEAVFLVRDNGAGFDMRFADKLFGAFQRLHDSSEYQGTGIGLATAQRVVHRHGGRIWAEGSPGAGATFYFTLASRVAPRV